MFGSKLDEICYRPLHADLTDRSQAAFTSLWFSSRRWAVCSCSLSVLCCLALRPAANLPELATSGQKAAANARDAVSLRVGSSSKACPAHRCEPQIATGAKLQERRPSAAWGPGGCLHQCMRWLPNTHQLPFLILQRVSRADSLGFPGSATAT